MLHNVMYGTSLHNLDSGKMDIPVSVHERWMGYGTLACEYDDEGYVRNMP